MVNKKDLFNTNSESHNTHTRQSNNLHLPLTNLTIYQQEVHYSGMKPFEKLPQEFKKNCNISE